jgi:cellulose synthase operon protein C
LYIKQQEGTFLVHENRRKTLMLRHHTRLTAIITSRIATAALCVLFGTAALHSQTPDVQAKFRLAQGFEQAGEYERAMELYGDLMHRDPGNYAYFDGLQRMHVQLKQYDEAIGVIRARLAMMPDDPTLYGLMGTVQYRAGREPDATRSWERAIAIAPANPQMYRIVANLMIELRLLDRAADMYRRGRAALNDPSLFALELGQLLAASMDYAGATEEFLLWLQQNPNQQGFVQNRLAAFTYKDDGRAAAARVVQAHIDRAPALQLYEILAWLHMEGKEYDRAFEVHRRIDELSSANGVSLLGFADRAFREHAYDVASRAYREATSQRLPAQRLPQARYGYACAMMELRIAHDSSQSTIPAEAGSADEARSRLGEAVAAFTKIVEEYPQSEFSAKALYQLGLIQFRYFQDLNTAARTFQQVLAEPALRPAGRNDVQLRMAELMIARGDTNNAVAALRTVAATPGATPDQLDEAQLGLAEIAFFNGRCDDATTLLGTIARNVQNDFANDAIELQVLLRENTGAAPQALATYGRAEFLARQRRYSEAVQFLLDIVQHYPTSPLVDDALLRAGGLLARTGRYAEALDVYNRLLTQFRDQSTMLDRALFKTAEIYQFGLGQPAQAIAAYERLIAEYAQSIMANDARKRIRVLRGETL